MSLSDKAPKAPKTHVDSEWSPELLTANEVADRLRVTPRTVQRYVAQGLLPYVRLPGGTTRYRAIDIDRLVNGNFASDDTDGSES